MSLTIALMLLVECANKILNVPYHHCEGQHDHDEQRAPIMMLCAQLLRPTSTSSWPRVRVSNLPHITRRIVNMYAAASESQRRSMDSADSESSLTADLPHAPISSEFTIKIRHGVGSCIVTLMVLDFGRVLHCHMYIHLI